MKKSKAKLALPDFPIKLVGEVSWVGGANPEIGDEVTQAIWRTKNEIGLFCRSSGYDYDVQLKSNDELHFEGTFFDKSKTYRVIAIATIYMNNEGIVLVGRWTEDGWEYRCWAELRVVESFAHESAVR